MFEKFAIENSDISIDFCNIGCEISDDDFFSKFSLSALRRRFDDIVYLGIKPFYLDEISCCSCDTDDASFALVRCHLSMVITMRIPKIEEHLDAFFHLDLISSTYLVGSLPLDIFDTSGMFQKNM